MVWIRMVEYEEATGKLRNLYDRVKGPGGQIDRILKAHGLRPHSLEGHMTLYKNVLHHSGNRLGRGVLEALGVYVSQLNGCAYCVAHHLEGMRKWVSAKTFEDWRKALTSDVSGEGLDARMRALLAYARVLTLEPEKMDEAQIESLRSVGLDDGEILEANQVIAYFAYANRTVLGLGISHEGERLGLSPNQLDEGETWNHQ